jgi:DHA1 family solute carrier family 18 vesicular amine transporter 1/2
MRSFIIVAFALFMDYLVYGAIIPVTPYAAGGVLTASHVAMLFAVYAAAVFVATPIAGYAGDRFGYRTTLTLGAALLVLSLALFWWSPQLPVLVIARLAQGAASAFTWTIGLSLIAEQYVARRVEMMGFALVGSTAGSLAGPLLGGGLYTIGGYALPFAVACGLAMVNFVLCLVALPADRKQRTGAVPYRALLSDPAILVPALAVALAALGWGIIEPLLPQHLSRAGDVAPWLIGALFTVGALVSGIAAPIVSWASQRVTTIRLTTGGAVAMACALPILGAVTNPVAVCGVLAVVSFSFAFLLNPTSAALADAVDRRGSTCYAAVYAVYNIAYSVGMIGASSFVSLAAPLGIIGTYLCASGTLLLCAPLLLFTGTRQPAGLLERS